jgi:hypothetical protein
VPPSGAVFGDKSERRLWSMIPRSCCRSFESPRSDGPDIIGLTSMGASGWVDREIEPPLELPLFYRCFSSTFSSGLVIATNGNSDLG